ncbi:hypothetical protein FG386_001612 [Cryptosporidium ryanae]|uniref:uncharacterized protein n=1 Tax=Cryptosporidium ryanae TaxID=515981 RepID=UPI00351A1E28|nr:hypothetical protein FG386_001612 [Cryptosporidium ryanae]
MERNTDNVNLDENIKLSILEYRERERQRYLRYKNDPTIGKRPSSNEMDERHNLKIVNNNSASETGNSNYFERSKVPSSSICSVNQGSGSCFRERQDRSGSISLLDNNNQLTNTTSSIGYNKNYNGDLTSGSSNNQSSTSNLGSEGTGTGRSSGNAGGTSKTKKSRQSSGIFSSIKMFATSIIGHSNKSHRTRENSRPSGYSRFGVNNTSSSSQQNVMNTIDRNLGTRDSENMTDEELARRIQIEEFNTINTFGTTESYIYYPSYQSFDTLHEFLPTQINCSSDETMKPFKGPKYNIEVLKLSDDESEET